MVVGIAILPVGQLSDSADNFLGGCLLFHDQRLYVDFFSQHNPLMYYLMAGLYKLLGYCDIVVPRFAVYAVFVGILQLFILYTRKYKYSILLLVSYALLSQRYSNHLVLAETWVMFASLVTLLLLWFHRRMSRWVFWILFIAVQISYLTANPLYIPIAVVLAVFFITDGRYSRLTVLLASFLPALMLFIQISPKDYIQSVILHNIYDYPACIGTPVHIYLSYASQIVHRLAAVMYNPANVFEYEVDRSIFELLLAGFLIFINLRQAKNHSSYTKVGLYSMLIAVLLAIRPETFRIQPFIFFALAQIAFLLPESLQLVHVILLAIMIRLFIPLYMAATGDPDTDAREYIRLIQQYTRSGDRVLVYPGRSAVYLVTQRMPGSYYNQYGPCLPSQAEDRVIHDIKQSTISLIIIDNKHNAFGKGLPSMYLQKTIEFLKSSPLYLKVDVDEYITAYRRIL